MGIIMTVNDMAGVTGSGSPPVTRADADAAAVGGIISVFVFPPLGVILGHVSRGQARRRGLEPSAVATWACALGYVFIAAAVAVLAVLLAAQPSASDLYVACIDNAVTYAQIAAC